MNAEQRQNAFVDAVKAKVGYNPAWKKPTESYGVSNKAQLKEGALQVCVGNLDNVPAQTQGFIFISVLTFPPAEDIYFAVIVKQDCEKLIQRLQLMIEIGKQQNEHLTSSSNEEDEEVENAQTANRLRYSDRNNDVAIYLAYDGKIYLRNKGFWKYRFPTDTSGLEPAAGVDKILFAVYPPEPSVKHSLSVRDYVGYFISLVGHDKVEEIEPWPDEITISPAMRRMPEEIPMSEIAMSVRNLGGTFTDGLLKRYHIALNHLSHKHFVILTGLSGTGKTRLARLYARAVHGIENADSPDPFFFMCPVRPDWTDPTGLIGYYDVISGKYIVTPFLEAVLIATAHRNTPVFVCIDEMNIARAEFYFADVLSAMESREPLQLHSSSVSLDGSRGEQVPDRIVLPSNLFITGTINIDESTQPLSDKILDRANTIDMSEVDISDFSNNLLSHFPDLRESLNFCSPLLTSLNDCLLPHKLSFGYRVIEEIVRYLSFVQRTGIMDEKAALDSQVAQKILVKLKGGERQRDLLDKLSQLLQPYPSSLKVVEEMQRQLEEYGSFQNLR